MSRRLRLAAIVFVVVGSALVVAPPARASGSSAWLRQTYLSDSGCGSGWIPLFGGWYGPGVPVGLQGSKPAYGEWSTVFSASGATRTLCAQIGDEYKPATPVGSGFNAGHSQIECPSGLSLISGGFQAISGSEALTASHPVSPKGWDAVFAGSGDATALCSSLPTGTSTYVQQTAGAAHNSTTASCSAGDFALNGGWDAAGILGSHPDDGAHGWTVDFGDSGGTAYALCMHRGTHSGIDSVRTATDNSTGYQAEATCGGDALLGAGWRHDGGLSNLRRFEGNGTSSWVVETPEQGTAKTAWAICAQLVDLSTVRTNVAKVGGGVLALLGLLALIGLSRNPIPAATLIAGLAGAAIIVGAGTTVTANTSGDKPPDRHAHPPLTIAPKPGATTTTRRVETPVAPGGRSGTGSGIWLLQTLVSGGGCGADWVPLFGGWKGPYLPVGLTGSAPSPGSWSASFAASGTTSSLCAQVGDEYRSAYPSTSGVNPGHSQIQCPAGSALISGGFSANGGTDALLASHPVAPAGWDAVFSGDGAATALCSALPTGTGTYVNHGSGDGHRAVTAACSAGDFALNGGWDAAAILGSHPTHGATGWTVEFGDAGGNVYALCMHRGAHSGIASVHTATDDSTGYQAEATCSGGEAILGAGWSHRSGLSNLRGFEGRSAPSWIVETPETGTAKSAWAICAQLVKPSTTRAIAKAGAGGLLALLALVALVGLARHPIPATTWFAGLAGAALVVGGGGGIIAFNDRPTNPPNLQATRPVSGGTTSTTTASETTSTAEGVTTTSANGATTTLRTTTTQRGATTTTQKGATTTTQGSGGNTTVPTTPATTTTTAPHVSFAASPASYSQSCGPNFDGLSAKTITLNNTGSSVPVSWNATADNLADNMSWAALSPASGTVPAGGTATFTITPRSQASCNSFQTSHDFHVTIAYNGNAPNGSGQRTVTDTASH